MIKSIAIDNVTKSVNKIESQLNLYVESLEKLKYYVNEIELRESTLYKDLSIDNFADFKSQLNFAGFLTISLLDLLVISKNFLLSKYKWERLHQIRLGYLLIHAVIQTYNIHGQQLKISSEKNSELTDLFKLITIKLKAFKKQHGYPDIFIEIRNSTIGHIDPDYKTYYDIINKIDDMKSFEAILDFMVILFKLQEFGKDNSNTLKLKVGNQIYTLEEFIKDRSE